MKQIWAEKLYSHSDVEKWPARFKLVQSIRKKGIV